MNKKVFFGVFCVAIALMINVVAAEMTGPNYIKGKILTEAGEALSGAQVCFYDVNTGPSPFTREHWRVCDQVARTGEDGSFAERIPSGEYYLIATKKLSGENPGPPIDAGDPTWPAWDGPGLKTYVVTDEGTTDIGVVRGAIPFKAEWLPAGKTAIEGRVLLENGSPVEGVLVYASADPMIREMVFISDKRTGPDGIYIVRVGEDGEYYVRALGASKPIEKASVRSGEITGGINIRVETNPSSRWDTKKNQNK